MIIVSDTGPLNYLVLLGRVEVLPVLYDQIVVPSAVLQELLRTSAPPTVQAWAAARPQWLEVRPSPEDTSLPQELGLGERQAIALRRSLQSGILLMDEKAGRRVAAGLGLEVLGTLGVLRDAHDAGLLHFPSEIEHLRSTNFRMTEALLKRVAP